MNLRHSLLAAIALSAASPGTRPDSARGIVVPPLAAPRRHVHMSGVISLAWVAWVIDILEGAPNKPSTGTMHITTGKENRHSTEHDFGCRTRRTRSIYGHRQWSCIVPFRHGAPDWTGIIAKLDSLGIMAPPAHDSPYMIREGQITQMICNDGAPWEYEVFVGGKLVAKDAQVCGSIDSTRARYEAGIDSVLGIVAAVARGSTPR
jgi:hypothetical protein